MPEKIDLTSPRQVMALFAERGLQPRKQLGQNFLIDANIARKIIAAVDSGPGAQVIEVGPGVGALTALLAAGGAKVLALEVDRGLVALLNQQFAADDGVTILHQDALKACWAELINAHFRADCPVKLVSNLPYVISGPFFYALFKSGFPFESAVVMLQKEVAQRMVADPGESDYGALSVLSSYYTRGQVLFSVSANVFWPKPKVGSAVIRLEPREKVLPPGEEALFWELVQGVFQQRRKTLLKNLIRLVPGQRERLPHFLQQMEINLQARPEELSADQFAMLTGIIYNYGKK